MNTGPRQTLRFFRRSAAVLFGAALAAGVAGCGRHQNPVPPSSTPRPTTLGPTTMGGGALYTADMQLHKRPVPPAPGPM